MKKFDDRPFIRSQFAIDSMRDNGFLSAAHALAEIIDNSVQAKSTLIDLIVLEKKTESSRHHIDEIAVLDNGIGMSAETLYLALEFGQSLNKNDPKGIGKFGMGLPNSSISQCKRVEVWSWEHLNDVNFTYLDIDEIKEGKLEHIPQPMKKEFPEWLDVAAEKIPESGTLVVWKKIDRCQWKTARSIKKHTENLVGRMYRYFLTEEAENKVTIKFKVLQPLSNGLITILDPEFFKANDPMYLLNNTNLPDLPGECKGESWFEILDKEPVTIHYTIVDESGNEMEKESIVTITTSVPKKFVWEKQRENLTQTLGSTHWGKHALKNMGVSIVRANRELELRTDLIQSSDWINNGKARFCGIEVKFDPELDGFFGVTNNKQHVVNLKIFNVDDNYENEGFESSAEYIDYLRENENYNIAMSELVAKIAEAAKKAKDHTSSFNVKGKSTTKDDEDDDLVSPVNDIIDTINDKLDENNFIETPKPTKDNVVKVLQETGSSEEEAIKIAERVMQKGLKVLTLECPLRTEAFFEVTDEFGLTYIQINTNHVFYEKILKQLQPEQKASLELCLAAWARYERDCISSKQMKNMLVITRDKWGANLTEFLSFDDV